MPKLCGEGYRVWKKWKKKNNTFGVHSCRDLVQGLRFDGLRLELICCLVAMLWAEGAGQGGSRRQ